MTKKQQATIKRLREGIELIKCKYILKFSLKIDELEMENQRLKEELKARIEG